jgi:hypothetical protein
MTVKNTDYIDLFMYVIGPLAIYISLMKLLKRKRKHHWKKFNRRLHIHPFSIVFGHSRTKWWFLALFAKDNL